jgi:hypothetical protein
MAYEMDTETYTHLYRWMANHARIGSSIIDETDAVVTFLQSLSVDEAAYYLDMDWGRAYADARELYALA